MGPATLAQVLRHLPATRAPQLLVGPETSDDAAVYKLSDELAIINTVDFFTPVVDDPYLFGQIAAANALSDIYAMGGKPLLALNIVSFPSCLPVDIMAEILRGGAEKVQEAGAIVAGGHTVQDNEPKYGLAVTGIVHPDHVLSNATAKPGDILVLTKPIGSGIINTAARGELVRQENLRQAWYWMSRLNNHSGAACRETASALTDITGFGLLGHAAEMARASQVSISLEYSAIPLLPQALEMARMGLIPAGAYANRDFLQNDVNFPAHISPAQQALLYDPQTSGGLLIAVPPENLSRLQQNLLDKGDLAAIIGEVTPRKSKLIYVT